MLQKRCKAEETHICTGCNYPFWHGPIRGVDSCVSKGVNGTCSWLDHTNRKHGGQEVDKTKTKHMNAPTKCLTVPIPNCCFSYIWITSIRSLSFMFFIASFKNEWANINMCYIFACVSSYRWPWKKTYRAISGSSKENTDIRKKDWEHVYRSPGLNRATSPP